MGCWKSASEGANLYYSGIIGTAERVAITRILTIAHNVEVGRTSHIHVVLANASLQNIATANSPDATVGTLTEPYRTENANSPLLC